MAMTKAGLKTAIVTEMDTMFEVQPRGRSDMLKFAEVFANAIVDYIQANAEAVIPASPDGDGLQVTTALNVATKGPAAKKTLKIA